MLIGSNLNKSLKYRAKYSAIEKIYQLTVYVIVIGKFILMFANLC